jgi:hypothetical protein
MEFKRFMDLLQDKGVKLVYMESHKELVEWNPELEDTYNVFAEKDGKTVMLESDEVVISWSKRGLKLAELVAVRSVLSSLCGKDVIPFAELIKQLIKEQGNYSEYVKAVIQIEDEGATKEDLDRAYDFFMGSDDCTLISQELIDVLADK